jgi:hypothetical protein
MKQLTLSVRQCRATVLTISLVFSAMPATVVQAQTANQVGFWYKPSEPGWGVSIQQQGARTFAVWFTYDADKKPIWHTLDCAFVSNVCAGDLYTGRGTPFAQITAGANATALKTGTGSLTQLASGKMNLSYTVGATTQSKVDLEAQNFVAATDIPLCTLQTGSRATATNYTDHWWGGSALSGWGVQISHQGSTVFFGWYSYNDQGTATWNTGIGQADTANSSRFSGTLYHVPVGVAFSDTFTTAQPSSSPIGTFNLNFTNGESGAFTYTLPSYGVTNRSLPLERFAIAGGATNLCAKRATPPPSNANLKAIAEASLTANVRKDHPHGTTNSNPGAPPTTSPAVPPGNAFTQGIPGDDIEQTALFSIGVITGEACGFDIFNAVNPADAQPGKGLVTAFYSSVCPNRTDEPGDRYLLGDHKRAYYLGRNGDIDNDFARMMQMDNRAGSEIVLYGRPGDYAMVETTGLEKGTAIFYNNNGTYDMIGYIDLLVKTSATDPIYKYVSTAPSAASTAPSQMDQFGGAGADLITAIEVDASSNIYVTGFSNSNLAGQFPTTGGTGQMFAAKYGANGDRMWLTQFGSKEKIADLVWDIAVDGGAVYVAARYVASESERNGSKDSAYFKLDTATGTVLKEEVWGGIGVQFAGAVALDNSEYVYFSGIGQDIAQLNPDQSQDPYIEKRRRSDLSLVKRKMFGGDKDNIPGTGGAANKEPWGGLTFYPKVGGAPGQGNIYSSGWVQASAYETNTPVGGGDVWLVAFDENLTELWSEGWGSTARDWAWDLDVDTQGNVYVVGMTLGAMAGPGSHKGKSDSFITKIDPTKPKGQRIVWTKQFGTDKNDELRKIRIVGDSIFVSGHTYGSIAATNAGQSDVWLMRLDLKGNVIRQFQIGTTEEDRAMVTADANGVYVGGYTLGSLVKPAQGFIDAFVLKFTRDLNPFR